MLSGRRRKWRTSSVSVTLGKFAQIAFDKSMFLGGTKKGSVCGGEGSGEQGGGPKEEGNAGELSIGEAYLGTPHLLSGTAKNWCPFICLTLNQYSEKDENKNKKRKKHSFFGKPITGFRILL